MVSVCIAYDTTEQSARYWEYALSHWAVDQLYILGRPAGEPDMGSQSPIFTSAVYIDDVSELPDDPLIVLAPQNGLNVQGNEDICAFTHPADAVYMTGSDHQHLAAESFANRAPDHKVYIKTASNDQMYSFMSWAVCAFDRKYKA